MTKFKFSVAAFCAASAVLVIWTRYAEPCIAAEEAPQLFMTLTDQRADSEIRDRCSWLAGAELQACIYAVWARSSAPLPRGTDQSSTLRSGEK
jgi:hypothetical protein